jgi:hypothetical protein
MKLEERRRRSQRQRRVHASWFLKRSPPFVSQRVFGAREHAVMSDFTQRSACESHSIRGCAPCFAMKAGGTRVAGSTCVTRIGAELVKYRQADRDSQVFITGCPLRHRAATADAPRSDAIRLALGVQALALLPLIPTFVQDDGRFRRHAEPFIVYRLQRSTAAVCVRSPASRLIPCR